jgi:predicted DNA binding protein
MSVIAEYTTDTSGLVLEETFDRVDATLDVERIYATDPERPILFAWVTVDDPAAFEAALDEDPTVTDVERLGSVEDGGFYRMQVTEAVETVLYPAWVGLGGEGLEARYEDGRWRSRIRLPDREALREYETYVTENGLSFDLLSIYDAGSVEGPPRPADGLTADQRETLLLAYERGFFDIPRRATAADLAAELDVSRQAVSERLRRGYAALVETHVR